MSGKRLLAAAVLTLFALEARVGAEETPERLPDRWGLAFSSAQSYSPRSVEFSTISYLRDWDHGKVWRNDGPPALRFRAELTVGLANVPQLRILGSGNIMAVRYVDALAGPMFRPYVEAGIGLVYTDFRVSGQGLRFNFNPQLGAGVEMKASPDVAIYAGARLHHVSNAGLSHDNRGINSVLMTTGVLFQ